MRLQNMVVRIFKNSSVELFNKLGGFLRLLLLFSTSTRSSRYSCHCQPSRRMFFRITFISYLAALSIRRYSMSDRLPLNSQPHALWTKLPLRRLHFSGSRPGFAIALKWSMFRRSLANRKGAVSDKLSQGLSIHIPPPSCKWFISNVSVWYIGKLTQCHQ